MTRRRRDPYSWTVVRLVERDLADSVLDLASPLLAALGPKASLDEARASIEIAVAFWNASVEASALWDRPSQKSLGALRKAGVVRVEAGEFAADMAVDLLNDGPVTILLDSRKLF